MISCDRATNLFGQAWDDELSVDEREALEAHFASCPACQRNYDEFARTLELVQGLPRPQVSDDFAERVVRAARGRELAGTRRERRPGLIFGFGGRMATAAALAATVAVGAFVLSRPHGVTPQSAAPTVAQDRTAEPLPTGTVRPTGDPDGPVTAMVRPARAAEPVRTAALPARAARRAGGAGATTAAHATLAGGDVAQVIPDSLFDHSADVDFVLDPVKVRRERGRGYTPVANPVRGEAASITF